MRTSKVLLILMVITMLLIPTTASGKAQGNEKPVLLPGMILGLAHNVNQRGITYSPLVEQYQLVQSHGGDLGGSSGEGFSWWSVPDFLLDYQCQFPGSVEDLPAGIVLGFAHNPNLPNQTAFGCKATEGTSPMGGLRRVNGGDRAGDSGQGYYWYATMTQRNPPSIAAEYWDYLERNLPMWTVTGLCHSMNRPDEPFYWRGETYNACLSQRAPKGFRWVNGGDLGAPAGGGYYWFEKTTGPMIVGKWINGEGPILLPQETVSTSNKLLVCTSGGVPAGWKVAASQYLAGLCQRYDGRTYMEPDVNVYVLTK